MLPTAQVPPQLEVSVEQGMRGATGVPVTCEQVPWLPARLHAWHWPVHDELQQ
jgi:hypothetical protein